MSAIRQSEIHNSTTKRIESLYILKALSSFCVVMVHSEFFKIHWFKFIIGVGTPCFLAITGYLLYSNSLEREQKKCTKWALKSFKLALICFLLYWIFYTSLGKHFSGTALLLNLIRGDQLCPTLWYLTALWQALLLFWLIRTYIPKLIYYLPLLFIVAYLFRMHLTAIFPFPLTWEEDWRDLLYLRNNAIVTSLPFLSTGYLIHKYKDWLLKNINANLWLPVVIFALLGEYTYRMFNGFPYGLFSFLSYPCIVLLMLFCVKHPQLRIPGLNYIGMHHSANIYYFHMIVMTSLRLCGIHSHRYEALIVWLLCIPISCLFNSTLALLKLAAGKISPAASNLLFGKKNSTSA